MTQRSQSVEPPISSTPVHVLVAVFAVATLMIAGVRTTTTNDPAGAAHNFGVAIDLNEAAPRELALLPGVGPVLAKRIYQNRQRLGPFATVEDVGRVYGVGEKTISHFSEYAVVHSDTADSSSRLAAFADESLESSDRSLSDR